MTAPKVNNDERFANQLILKFNILNFKKKNALENVKKLNDIGPRYFNYIEHVESQVDMIQQYLPSMLGGSYAEGTQSRNQNFGISNTGVATESVRYFIENSSESLQTFLELYDQFLLLEL